MTNMVQLGYLYYVALNLHNYITFILLQGGQCDVSRYVFWVELLSRMPKDLLGIILQGTLGA